jgi:hypothetical protein
MVNVPVTVIGVVTFWMISHNDGSSPTSSRNQTFLDDVSTS